MTTLAAETFLVENPYSGEVVGEAPIAPLDEVRRLLDLHAAARTEMTRYERAQILERTASRLADAEDELARLITLESGLCLKDTRYEVRRAVDVFRFAASETLRDDGEIFACDTSANGRRRRAHTTREPVGLVAAITPFNHPLNQVAHKVAPAIAAGAPIVLKPSEKTPLSAVRLARELTEAGLPEEACSIVTGDRERILDAMLDHSGVEVLSFTGSVAVGKQIAGRLGYRRAVLELGGNDPLLVLADADLDQAAALAVSGATRNSGQRCTAVKRILVEEHVADDFVERLVDGCRELVAGDPLDPSSDVGTVIDEDAAITIERRIDEAVAAGAELLAGGARNGALVEPAVLDRVPADCSLVAQETFGPVAPVLRVRGLDEAIALANSTPFGLSAGVVSNDLAAITRCIRELRCGTVNVNEVPGYRTELAPFGGIKDSGLGIKEGVAEAIRAFTNVKLYTLPWP
jgi:putative phosphonoacetaldehyde dehydrogenase